MIAKCGCLSLCHGESMWASQQTDSSLNLLALLNQAMSSWLRWVPFLCTGGYSGIPIDGKDECVSFPGFGHHLCMAWRQDNAGPHSVEEVTIVELRSCIPNFRTN